MPASAIHDLKTLVLSMHPMIAVETVEEERVERMATAAARELDLPLFEWTVTQGLVKRPEPMANRALVEPAALLGHIRGLTVEGIFLLKDFARHLEDPAVCRLLRELARQWTQTHSTLVITGPRLEFPPEVDHHVVHLDLALPSPGELEQMLGTLFESLRQRGAADVKLPPSAVGHLVKALAGMTLNQARQAVARAVLEDGRLDPDDIQRIVERKAQMMGEGGLLEIFPAKDNDYELGGFRRLMAWLERARIGYSQEAAELGLSPPRGILMVGVQGCGKSLAAKCIARRWRFPLVKLDAGRLYDKYVGETEKNLRKAIDVAESMAPVVLWIDEIEKGFASVTSDSNDGGVSQRILATLLTWMQEKKGEVFLVATANDVFSLPPEMLRKGRFDEIFFVDLPDPQEREQIFRIHLAQRKQEPAAFDLATLVAASEGFSGAEIEQAVIASLYGALHRKAPLDTQAVLAELTGTVPLSVSRREDIDRLRQLAGERFVPVN